MSGPRVVYQHPLAYLLGLEGVALLRAYGGEYDREFTLARFREVRELLDSAERLGDGVEAVEMTTQEAYARWAPFYDEPGNELIDLEERVVRELVAALPIGVAVDAACGTGRHAAYLAERGHRVTGVDSSPEMLAIARAKMPRAELVEGDLHALPLADASVDLVVCGLALMHVPDLGRALAELRRVLRPQGRLVVSDVLGIRLPAAHELPDGRLAFMPVHVRTTERYLAAALPLGLEVRGCVELIRDHPLVNEDGIPVDGDPAPPRVPGRPPDVWALHPFCPAAANAAFDGTPIGIVFEFEARG